MEYQPKNWLPLRRESDDAKSTFRLDKLWLNTYFGSRSRLDTICTFGHGLCPAWAASLFDRDFVVG